MKRTRNRTGQLLFAVSALLAAASGVTATDYDLAVADTMQRVRIDQPYTGLCARAGALTVRPYHGSVALAVRDTPRLEVAAGGGREASLSAAGGEAEGFQLVIMARQKDLAGVTLTASPLRSRKPAHSIPAGQVTFEQVGYVKTRRPCYGVERAGWFADPLLAPKTFDVKKGATQPVWVTIRVPADTPKGIYTGAITVKPGNAAAARVPVKLRVWGFNVPRAGSLGLAFTWFGNSSAGIHGKAEWTARGMQRKYMDMLLDHRVGPDSIYRGSPPSVEDATYAVKRGAPSFNLFNVGWPVSFTDAQVQGILDRIGAVWPGYKKAGIADQAYVFGFDETYREKAIKQIYGAIGEKYPGLRRMACTGVNGAVGDYVDIWAMSVGTYWHHTTKQAELVSRLRERGVEFWMYLSTSAGPPLPNWWIESPLIESRSLMWHLYDVNADGFLYYAINHSTGRQAPIDEGTGPYTTWNARSFMQFNGDGHLIYAGRNGPLPSVRLANIRDGLEDYEYMKILERRLLESGKVATKEEARERVNKEFVGYMVENFWIHSQDPGVLRSIRDRLAMAIEAF